MKIALYLLADLLVLPAIAVQLGALCGRTPAVKGRNRDHPTLLGMLDADLTTAYFA